MFNLNEAIDNWRKSCSDQQTITPADRDELETHLREEIDHLVLAGLTEEEAFLIAARRLGDTQSLAVEFGKVNRSLIWRTRAFWMLAGVFLVTVAQSAAGTVTTLVSLLLVQARLNPYLAGSIGFVVNSGLFLLLLLGLFGLMRWQSARRRWQNKPALFLLLVATGVLLLRAIPTLSSMLVVRMYEAEQIGQWSMARSISSSIWGILWPFLLAVLLLALWPNRPTQKPA